VVSFRRRLVRLLESFFSSSKTERTEHKTYRTRNDRCGSRARLTRQGRRSGAEKWTATVIPVASGVRVWIATGHTDIRRRMNSMGLLVQEALTRDLHGDNACVFRSKSRKLSREGQPALIICSALERAA